VGLVDRPTAPVGVADFAAIDLARPFSGCTSSFDAGSAPPVDESSIEGAVDPRTSGCGCTSSFGAGSAPPVDECSTEGSLVDGRGGVVDSARPFSVGSVRGNVRAMRQTVRWAVSTSIEIEKQ
jgi:hypothetical protein